MQIYLKLLSTVGCIAAVLVSTACQPQLPFNNAQEKNIPRSSANQEQTDCDVVIVGAGISGLSAALELGRGGAKTVVIDMASVYGGHAVMSQGGVCIVDTPAQEAAGIEDSPDLAYRDFLTWGEDANEPWVRYYVDHSRREIFDWLTELGVQFASIETAPGNSVDRFHQPKGRGIGLVTPIYRECLRHENIQFVWNRQAEKLLVEDGRAVGVVAQDTRTSKETTIRAAAVVLATGGFQSNLDMVRQFWPREFRFPKKILVGSGRNSVGLGHRLAQQLGGNLVKMDHQWNYFTGIPDPRFPGSNRGLSAANMYGIIVNAQGRRFANLHDWAKEVMPKMLDFEEATLWFVFDEASRPKFVISGTDWADVAKVNRYVLDNPEFVQSAETLEDLAQKTGLPSKNLAATIRRYNQLVEQGEDQDFGRFGPQRTEYNNTASPKIETPPFYAMQAFPLTRKSMGGVAIDLHCRVLDKNGQTLKGLFAVGELTGLAGVNGKAALEGTFLGPCIVTGRVAGRSILQELSIKPRPIAQDRCIKCHDLKKLIAEPRPGHWHFEQSHEAVLERKWDCLQCHGELAPYNKQDHQIDPQVLTASCANCHVATE